MKTYFSTSLFLLLLLLSTISFGFSVLPRITLYGRVLDQHNQPVKGITVLYVGTSAYLAEGGGRGQVLTDEEGYFVIKTTGDTLSLWGIDDPSFSRGGYSSSSNTNLHPKSKNMNPDWRKHSEKENAYIINAWRLGKYEGAIKGTATAYTYFDDRKYTINLLGKNYKTQVKEGIHKGHLIVSCTRKKMDSLKDYGDWTVTISPIDGSIQTTNDLYMNEAPDSGYQSSITIDMKRDSKEYKPALINQHFYFTANNGLLFGSLDARLEPHRNYKQDRCSIEFNAFKLNETGSRSLELKRQPTSKAEPIKTNSTTFALM